MCVVRLVHKAVCRNFAKGRDELGVFKKEGRCSCKQRQGEHWKTMKKLVFVILRGEGGEIDTRGGGGKYSFPPLPPP